MLSQYDLRFLMWKYYNSQSINIDFNKLSEDWEYFGVYYFGGCLDKSFDPPVLTDDLLKRWEQEFEKINENDEDRPYNDR